MNESRKRNETYSPIVSNSDGRSSRATFPMLWLSLFLCLLFLPRAIWASPDVNRKKGGGTEIGEPVAANTGGFYWKKRLMDLGGVLPITFDISCYMNDEIGGNKCYLNLINTYSTFEYAGRQGVSFELGALAETPRLLYNPDLGYYREMYESKSGRQYIMKETTEYFYLQDPVGALVYIFEKSGEENGRLRWLLDRNGNRITYRYAEETDTLPEIVYEGDGSEGNRILYIATAQASNEWVATVGEIVWVEGEQQAGRSASIKEIGGLLAWVMDPKENVTGFTWNIPDGGYMSYIESILLPRGNTPFTQTAIQREYFDGSTNLLVSSQTDAYDNRTELAYDASNYSDRIVENRPDGASVVHDHTDMYGPPTSWTDDGGNEASFSSDSKNRLTSATDRSGGTTGISYDDSGRIGAVVNAKGDRISHAYTAQDQTFANPSNAEEVVFTFHNLTRVDYPDSTYELFAHDACGNVTLRTDRTGQTWSYTYNDRGLMLTEINPAGGIRTFTYNDDGTMASSTDSETGVATYGYDEHKRRASVVHPGGGTVRMAYDDNDNLVSATDERENTTEYEYDDNDNLTRTLYPIAASASRTFDLMDRPDTATDERAKTTTFGYDTMGRLSSVADPNGNRTEYAYNTRGWPTHRTDPADNVWLTDYDQEGLPTSTTTPLENTSAFEYDVLGHVVSVTDPLGNRIEMARDSMNRVTVSTDALGRSSGYSYDGNDNMTGATLPEGSSFSYRYDEMGALDRITDSNGENWLFVNSPMGRLSETEDPLGRKTQFSYDARGLPDTASYPDGATEARSYDDSANLVEAAFDQGPTLGFAYDSMNRLTAANDISFQYDDAGNSVSTEDSDGIDFSAAYDDGGRLDSVGYNNEELTVQYEYDSRDLLTRVSDDLSGAQIDFQYDADSRLAGIARSNGVFTAFSWDAASRLERKQDGTFMDLQYTYDAAGEVTKISVTAPLDPASFPPPAPVAFSCDAACQIDSEGFAYDLRGRRTAGPGAGYGWDHAERLVQVVEDGVTTLFGYNGLGHLRMRDRDGEKLKFYYNHAVGRQPVVAERDYDSGKMLRFYVYTPDGRLLYMVDHKNGNAVYFYHFDRMGSTLALTDTAGDVVDSYAYTPFGMLLQHDGDSPQPFTYIGQHGVLAQTDSLYCMRARYYDAATMRFLSKDPVWPDISSPQTINPYQYALNNPLTWSDPSGLYFTDEQLNARAGGYGGRSKASSGKNGSGLTVNDALEYAQKAKDAIDKGRNVVNAIKNVKKIRSALKTGGVIASLKTVSATSKSSVAGAIIGVVIDIAISAERIYHMVDPARNSKRVGEENQTAWYWDPPGWAGNKLGHFFGDKWYSSEEAKFRQFGGAPGGRGGYTERGLIQAKILWDMIDWKNFVGDKELLEKLLDLVAQGKATAEFETH